MGATEPNFLWLLAFNAFLAYFTNLTNFLVLPCCVLQTPITSTHLSPSALCASSHWFQPCCVQQSTLVWN